MRCLLSISLVFVTFFSFGQRRDVCDIYGAIYFTQAQEWAQFRMFETDSEVFADLVIYEETNRLFADRQGLWYVTEDSLTADHYVYYTENRGLADFTVYFTDIPAAARCNNP